METPKSSSVLKLKQKEIASLLNSGITERDSYTINQWELRRNEILNKLFKYPFMKPIRWRLSDERKALTHHFEIGIQEKFSTEITGASGYIVCGMYDNWQLGEIFIVIDKQGSLISGITDALAMVVSIALQHGIPLKVFIDKFKFTSFQPAGIVKGAPTKDLSVAKSILDYLARWLEKKFPDGILVESERPSSPKF